MTTLSSHDVIIHDIFGDYLILSMLEIIDDTNVN